MAKLIWDDRIPQILPLEMTRGDDVKFEFAHPYGPGSAVEQVRMQILDKNDVVRMDIALDTDPDQVNLTEDYLCVIEIYNANTEGIDLDNEPFHYAVEMYDLESLRLTTWSGTFSFINDYITDGVNSPSESWATRTDLDEDIAALQDYLDSMAGIMSMTRITQAVSVGVLVVNVADGTIFTTADTVRVQDAGGYTTYGLDAVSSTTITLDTTSGDTSEVGDIVMKVI